MSTRITVNQVPIEWSDAGDRFSFFGIEGIILWKDPSLLSLLAPLRRELGEDLFALLLAFEVSRGTYDDYFQMVENLGASFEEGFEAWGRAVSGAGWGSFTLESMDWPSSTAVVRIDRPWELHLFPDARDESCVPFMDGKISGIFSWAFGTGCRARILERDQAGGEPFVRLQVRPSATTLAQELEALQQHRSMSHEALLQATNRSLREHLDRFFDALNATGEFVCELDTGLVIRFATDPLAAILEQPNRALEGRQLTEFLTEESSSRLSRGLTGTAQPDHPERQFELEVVTAGQGERTIALGIRPTLDLDGHIIGYRGAGRDITQQRAQERELAAYQAQLERAVRRRTEELERFTRASAHHLQEPLRRIAAFASRLDKRYSPAEGGEPDPDVARIQANIEHMSELLQGVQRYLALDTEDLHPEATDTGALLSRAWQSLDRAWRGQGAELTREDPLPAVHADPHKLVQLFRLLLENAIGYARPEVPPHIHVSATTAPEGALFRVRDNGPGIAPEYRDRAFQMFERLQAWPDLPRSGTGLALARKIVEAHGGRIWIEDAVEPPGATVAFTLPEPPSAGAADPG